MAKICCYVCKYLFCYYVNSSTNSISTCLICKNLTSLDSYSIISIFGSGKSFLVSALLNELHEKKKASVCMIYFPEALRTLKDDWDNFGSKIEYFKSVDILLIDDIGAEKVTEWGRDEVLGTILQARMDSKLATFFTSNLNIKELESHLALSNKSDDLVKARRIIERIKQLTNDIELISVNRREK